MKKSVSRSKRSDMRSNTNGTLPLAAIGTFPSEWRETTLSSICSLVTDGTHDSPKETKDGYPLVTGKAIKNRKINFAEAYNISTEDHLKVIARSKPQKNDILFANIGNSIGDLVRVTTDKEFSIKNVALFKPGNAINPLFLEYYLLSPQVQGYIKNTTLGSAQPFISLGTLREFPVPLPSKQEQDQIANILSAIDNKINLNECMNETLEAIAQALFKSWFVDFDPVKAKTEDYKHEGVNEEIIPLFPSTFVDSPLGAIPEEWKVLPLVKCSSTLRRGISPYYTENGGIRVINQKCIRNRQVNFGLSRRHNDTKKPIKDRLLEPGDILINSTGVGTLGRVAQLWHIDEPTTFDSHVTLVRANGENISSVFLGLELLRKETKIERLGEGSTGQIELSREILGSLLIAVPPIKIQKCFEEILLPIIDKITQNQLQILTLSKLRDELLPRLISGKLRVDEASKIVEAVAP